LSGPSGEIEDCSCGQQTSDYTATRSTTVATTRRDSWCGGGHYLRHTWFPVTLCNSPRTRGSHAAVHPTLCCSCGDDEEYKQRADGWRGDTTVVTLMEVDGEGAFRSKGSYRRSGRVFWPHLDDGQWPKAQKKKETLQRRIPEPQVQSSSWAAIKKKREYLLCTVAPRTTFGSYLMLGSQTDSSLHH
jgi:hypothetical protein